MPTIIALDVSLSMTRYALHSNEETTYHQLATAGINQILNYLSNNSKLEAVSLVVFSNFTEVVVEFTKNYDLIKDALYKIEHYDKNNLEEMLRQTSNMFQTAWGGNQNHCQLVIISDCGHGMGSTNIKSLVSQHQSRRSTELLPLPFPSNISIMSLGSTKDPSFAKAILLYQQLLDLSKQKGNIFTLESLEKQNSEDTVLNKLSTEALFLNMAEKNYKPFESLLLCGAYSKLESNVYIWPSPLPYQNRDVFGVETSFYISHKIQICGYLNLSDIGSPRILSRHLILPKKNQKQNTLDDTQKSVKNDFEKLENDIRNFYSKSEGNISEEELTTNQTDSNKENVCVLLHGALKIENVAALVLLNENWYGFIFSSSIDSKKKSNLMLSILPHGHDVLPWLGDLRFFGTIENAVPGETLVVKSSEKRSYSQNIVVWIKRSGLQSDIQKILRTAKKLPEKTTHFYKELNRIKRAALSLGFIELLDGIASIFEHEIPLLPASTNPEVCIQLKHAANELRKLINHDFKAIISALPTKYNHIQ